MAEGAVLRRPAVLHLSDRHRRLPPGVQPGAARRSRRLPVAAGIPLLPGAWQRQAVPASGLGARPGRFRHLLLPVVFRSRSDPALRRHDHCRHGGGPDTDRAGVRGGAPRHGYRPADHLRAIPRLWPARRIPAGRAGPSRLLPGPDRQPAVVRHRRPVRHADLRFGHLHLPVHPVRLLP